MKKSSSQKSVQKKCKSAGALSLNVINSSEYCQITVGNVTPQLTVLGTAEIFAVYRCKISGLGSLTYTLSCNCKKRQVTRADKGWPQGHLPLE